MKRMFMCALIFLSLAIAIPSWSVAADTGDFNQLSAELDKLNITQAQYDNLMLASRIGSQYNLGKILMAIEWQESKAGKFGPVGDMDAGFGKRSYGLCQIKVKTARKMLKLYPSLGKFDTDEELIANLLYDNDFNLKIAAHLLLHLRKQGMTEDQMIQTYNRGYAVHHPERKPYTRSVIESLRDGNIITQVLNLHQTVDQETLNHGQ